MLPRGPHRGLTCRSTYIGHEKCKRIASRILSKISEKTHRTSEPLQRSKSNTGVTPTQGGTMANTLPAWSRQYTSAWTLRARRGLRQHCFSGRDRVCRSKRFWLAWLAMHWIMRCTNKTGFQMARHRTAIGTTTSHQSERGTGVFRSASTSGAHKGVYPGYSARSSSLLEGPAFDRLLQLGFVRA
jgi:hypothetical protein